MRSFAGAGLLLLFSMPTVFAQETAPPVASAPPAESRLDYAQRLLDEEDNTEANLLAALVAYDESIAVGMSPSQAASVYADKATALMRLGDLQGSKAERQSYYVQGRLQAEKGLAADPTCADARFMRAANLGVWLREQGIFKSLSLMGEIREGFEETLELDPRHSDALLALAKMDETVPRLMGGSKKRAEQRFRLVLEQNPHFTRAMLDYAEFLHNRGHEAEGLELVNRALTEEQPKDPGAYRKFDRPRAEALREKFSR